MAKKPCPVKRNEMHRFILFERHPYGNKNKKEMRKQYEQ